MARPISVAFSLFCCTSLFLWSLQTGAASGDHVGNVRQKRSDDTSPLQAVVDTLSQQVTSLTARFDALQNSVNARLDTQQKDVDARVTAMENQQNIIHEDNKHILVYRLTAGSGTPAYRSYLTDWNCGCSTTDTSQSCDRYYRSRFLDLWPSDLIDTVRVSVYEHGFLMAFVEFNGQGSTNTNWFSADRLLNSTWTDLKTAPHNFFAITGDSSNTALAIRHFFIESTYAGCEADNGWLVVIDGHDVCDWAQGSAYPIILYSRRSNVATWSHSADVGRADVMKVTVKLKDGVDFNQNCPA